MLVRIKPHVIGFMNDVQVGLSLSGEWLSVGSYLN